MIIEPDTFPPEETPQPPAIDPLLARDITIAVNLAFCKTVCMMVAHNTIGRSAEPQATAESILGSFHTHLQSHIAVPDHAVSFVENCVKAVTEEVVCPFVKKNENQDQPATPETSGGTDDGGGESPAPSDSKIVAFPGGEPAGEDGKAVEGPTS